MRSGPAPAGGSAAHYRGRARPRPARSAHARGIGRRPGRARPRTVPKGRLKGEREHRAPPSERAAAIPEEARGRTGGHGFPTDRGRPRSASALSKLLREPGTGAVPHGVRPSFRDWAAECPDAPRDVRGPAPADVTPDRAAAACSWPGASRLSAGVSAGCRGRWPRAPRRRSGGSAIRGPASMRVLSSTRGASRSAPAAAGVRDVFTSAGCSPANGRQPGDAARRSVDDQTDDDRCCGDPAAARRGYPREESKRPGPVPTRPTGRGAVTDLPAAPAGRAGGRRRSSGPGARA